MQVMFSLELSYPTTKGPEYPNITKAQEKDPKTTYMKMTTVLKEEMNKSLKEKQENINKSSSYSILSIFGVWTFALCLVVVS